MSMENEIVVTPSGVTRAVSIGAVMTGGAFVTQRKRQEDDWYPTPPEVTHGLLNYFRLKSMGDIWEPCAGDGAIIDVLKERLPGSRIWASDINPRRSDIAKQDFLTLKGPIAQKDATIITNPPFVHAEKFIRQGFDLGVKRQAILLKSSYFHAMRRTKLFREHRPSHKLDLNWRVDFMGLGRPVMEVSWIVFDSPCSPTTTYDIIERPE